MSIYTIYFCYQPTKNMKYIGPKSSVTVPIKKEKNYLINHSINYTEKLFGNVYNHVVVGFESDKVLKCLKPNNNLNYSVVLDYKNTNHGRIIKDILLKYSPVNYNGIFLISDISFIITEPLKLNPHKNYIFTTSKDITNTDITCNVIDDNVEYLSYNSSDYYWNGMCYMNNETIRLLKHFNRIKFTDPLFLLEIINYLKDHGVVFTHMPIKNKQYTYINNNTLKTHKVCNE